MSLFEYAQKIVSDKLEKNKSPMLTISMGMEPVMPMAQGGGLSTVLNSLNINGQPHRLAYINPNEEDLLKSLGGSGEKVNGIPAYLMGGEEGQGADGEAASSNDGIDDSVDGGSNQGAPDDQGGFGTMGVGGYSDAQSIGTTQGLSAAIAEADAEAAAQGEVEAYSSPQNQAIAPDLGFYGPYSVPEQTFKDRANLSKSKGLSIDLGLFGILGGLLGGPLGAVIGKGADSALGTSVGINTGIGAQSMGYGDTGTGTQGGSGQDGNVDDGTDAGGDDIIIREKIAAVKKVPVEEVTVEEVERAKRLTAAQRVAGTRLEDILDDIYGSGKGAGLLGIATNNTGTA